MTCGRYRFSTRLLCRDGLCSSPPTASLGSMPSMPILAAAPQRSPPSGRDGLTPWNVKKLPRPFLSFIFRNQKPQVQFRVPQAEGDGLFVREPSEDWARGAGRLDLEPLHHA